MSRGSATYEEEPGYWQNFFKPWYASYKESAYRVGMVHKVHLRHPEFESHDLGFHNKALTQRRGKARLYQNPFTIEYPRECCKVLSKYYDCRMGHGVHDITEDVPQCNGHKAEIFEDCPHWVLENMALKKRFFARAKTIDNETYRQAMVVSDYVKQDAK
jgi:hypothetical protein